MPSGSHAGSPGSHSSGGSSFGGGASSNSGSDFGPDRGPGRGPGGIHTTIFVGGPRGGAVVAGRAPFSVLGLFLMIFAWVFAIIALSIGLTSNADIKKIKHDYDYYNVMISTAKENPADYTILAKVTDYFESGTSGQYYIVYEFNGGENKGYSYSVFTLEQAEALKKGGLIALAINDKNTEITQSTDSIPLICAEYGINQDAEYISAKNTIKIGVTILSIVAGGLFIASIIVFIKHKKDINDTEMDTVAEVAAATSKAVEVENDGSTVCKYCGSRIDKGEKRCSSCGASVRK